ncbi:MAG: 3-phosphoglycerate dehydrogenase [Oscillospiraceae bacterium]|jgi:D-3-phosphoglycerate dehydrogenase|nr:3-phosphoglycerate dehydrogenase [Oscillospiraceae bacterium]
MSVYTIKTLNNISPVGLLRLPAGQIAVDAGSDDPDAILVRSADMHSAPLHENLLCIARAGAGVNNIPVDQCSQKGIVVFNTPGANANAVKELVICALLLASRDIMGGVSWARQLKGDVPGQVEKGKSAFVGPEIAGKTLGIIGVGAIGGGVANAAIALGMEVLGYDPYISVDAAWGLSRSVHRAYNVSQLLAESDYISLHVPLNEETRLMYADMLKQVKKGVRIINSARGGLINSDELLEALDNGTVTCYVTDFPDEKVIRHPNVIPIPHLGSSTPESEDNCACMAVDQTSDYLLYGNIKNSVNFPDVSLPPVKGARLCVIHNNVPNVISGISSAIAGAGLNIENMVSKSKKETAYAMLDITGGVPDAAILARLRGNGHIVRIRVLEG